MNRFSRIICSAATIFGFTASASLADGGMAPAHIPNFAAIGIGGVPDYLGSDDYEFGAAPLLRYNLSGERYISLEANYLTANLLDHPNWRVGPAGIYRIGRDSVDDPIVGLLRDVDDTFELGVFAAYEIVAPGEPRDRWRFGGDLLFDVGDVHNGYVATLSVRRWLPLGATGALGLGAATTFASDDYNETYFSVSPAESALSGLNAFNADGGMRDARVTVAYVQPLNRNWILGVGAQYMRLLDDAADSPIVDRRGDEDQFIYGAGVGYAW